MFCDSKWITNDYKKIKNPTKYPGIEQIYQGNLDPDFDFKFQTNNFNKIKSSLEHFQIYPREIYYGLRFGKSIFVVCFSDSNLIWQKYEGEKMGSSQNYIYWKNKKYNTTHWINFTKEQIGQILNN